MKRKNIFKNFLAILALLSLTTGCDDSFLQDKKDYNGFNEEIYDNVLTAQAKVDYIYYLSLPIPAKGNGDTYSKSTEEYAGSTMYTQPTEITSNNVDDKFYVTATGGPYSYIRECNMFLTNIDKGALTTTEKNPLKGQVFFWRAWHYFNLVFTYGGVPIILEPQNPILGDGGTQSSLAVQRNTTAECMKQICNDLDSAISLLPGKWGTSDWGRLTAGAAAAFKGRVLLTYASPLFNRNDDVTRWQAAYDANLAAKTLLEANGFGLADGSGNRAKNWGAMFCDITSKEAVMTVLCNNITTTQAKNNGWEASIRPKDIQGSAGIVPTADILDLFPMADGKRPGESSYVYDSLKFYKNRDPRFYRTFAFNGCIWPYDKDITYTVWTYQWYKDAAAFNVGTSSSGTAEYSGATSTGLYLRKRSADANAVFDATNKFALSATPYMEIRFAEVLMNLGEAAVGIGKTGVNDEGYQALIQIRKRVGIPAGANGLYGLEANLDRYGLFKALLYERQVEFAYEGKRFDDMRRWMLWNDDPADNNTTCAKLGIKPFNGARRTGLFLGIKPTVYTASKSGIDYDAFNPSSKAYKPTLVTRSGIGLNPDADDATFNAQMVKLDNFYDTNLKRIKNDLLDPTNTNPKFSVTFRSKYYFLGFKQSVMQQSPYLYQTKGWTDFYGAEGTFDPLK